MGWIDQPDWRGRKRYWDVRWGRTPETDIAVGKFRKKHSQGWQDDWFLLFRRLGEDQVNYRYLFSQSFQTSGTSVTLSSLSPAWNNANNTVEGVGGGGSGAAQQQNNSAAFACSGGGGGEYRKIANFSDPGGATPMQIGQGGAAQATTVGGGAQTLNGANGTDTTFNTSSLIAVHGNGGVVGSSASGGAGGTAGTGAAAHNDGGRGGNVTSSGASGCTGGGGAGGPNGAGNPGVDIATSNFTTGGQGDGTSGGAGGSPGSSSGGTPATSGSPGTELGDSVHGCGGGGAAWRGGNNSANVGGSGGLYGAGGGGCYNSGSGNNASTRATSGAGANGIIVLTWTAAAGGFVNWGFDTAKETGFGWPKVRRNVRPHQADGRPLGPFVNWKNSGWEVQPPQPRIDLRQKRGAGIKFRSEFAFFPQWFNVGFDPVRSQEPRRRWERSAAGIMRGDDGTQFPFVPPVGIIWGFDIQQQPQHPRPERAGAIARWADGRFPFIDWKNVGWEIQSPQPPHPRPERNGANMRGDDGIEFSLINFYPFGFPQTQSQEPRRRWERTAATMRGSEIEVPFVNWKNSGWEVAPHQPQHPRPERFGAIAPSSNIEIPFTQWFNTGWEVQPWQPPHPRPEKSGANMRGDEGTEFPFIPPQAAIWWEIQPALHPHRVWKNPDVGDSGIVFPFVPPPSAVWWEVQPLQLRLDLRQKRGAGIKTRSGFAFFNQWVNFGFEPIRSQEPRRKWERIIATVRGDDGIEFPFVPPTAPTWWEIQPTLHPHRLFKSPSIGDVGIQFPLINFFPYGWEVQPPQPPHPRPERVASFLFGDTGTEAPFIFVQGNPMGWEVQPWQPPHPWQEKRFGGLARGDDGIEFPFIRWFNVGWEPSLGFPQRVFRERRAGIFKGDDGIEFQFAQWRNTGWEPVLSFPQRVFRERRAGILKGDEGIQGRFVQWRNTGWEPVLGFPQRVIRERREGAVALGSPGTEFPFVRFFNSGWVIQPWQPPHRRPERAGGIMVGDTGIEAPFRFVVAVPTWGFTQPDIIPRHRFERAGALRWGDEGLYFPFVPPTPPFVRPRHATQLLVIGDPDAFFGPTSIGYTGGSRLVVNQPANMVFDLKHLISSTDAIDIVLTAPDGSIRHGDPNFAFPSAETFNYYTFVPFMPYQYVVYTFAQGELDQIGRWQVSIRISNPGGLYSSSIRTFEVTLGP